jgi:hypothetical protein
MPKFYRIKVIILSLSNGPTTNRTNVVLRTHLGNGKVAGHDPSPSPEQTARWLEFAVHILSHRLVDGNIRRGSFADYVVPKFISDVLRLDSIVCCTVEGLREFEKLDHPLAKAWRETDGYDSSDWASKLCEKAGCSMTTFYERRKEWLPKYHVDISNPHAYYRDLQFYAPASLVLSEGRTAFLAARRARDGDEALRLHDDADRSFFVQMSEIVGAAVSSPPPLMRAKVEGEVKAIARQPKQAVPAGGVPARRLGSPQKALPPPPSGPSAPDPRPSSSAREPSGGGSPPVDEAAGAMLPKMPGPSSVPLTRRRRTWAPKPSTLPYGVDRQSSRQDLRMAFRAVREKLGQDPPDDERDHLEQNLDELRELWVRRKEIIKRQKLTLRENKAIARLKRMGGLPPLPREPPKPTKPGKRPPKK